MKPPVVPSKKLAVVVALVFSALVSVPSMRGQTLPTGSQTVYDDALGKNGWQNYGWATLNYANAAPVHGSTGTSIRVDAGAYQALYLHHAAFDSTPLHEPDLLDTRGQRRRTGAPTPGYRQRQRAVPP